MRLLIVPRFILWALFTACPLAVCLLTLPLAVLFDLFIMGFSWSMERGQLSKGDVFGLTRSLLMVLVGLLLTFPR